MTTFIHKDKKGFLTVGELKAALADAPDELEIFLDYEYWEGDYCGCWSDAEEGCVGITVDEDLKQVLISGAEKMPWRI